MKRTAAAFILGQFFPYATILFVICENFVSAGKAIAEDLPSVSPQMLVSPQMFPQAYSLAHAGKVAAALALVCILAVLVLKKFGDLVKRGEQTGDTAVRAKDITAMRVVRRLRLDSRNELAVVSTAAGELLVFALGPSGAAFQGFLNQSGSFLLARGDQKESAPERSGSTHEFNRWKLGGAND